MVKWNIASTKTIAFNQTFLSIISYIYATTIWQCLCKSVVCVTELLWLPFTAYCISANLRNTMWPCNMFENMYEGWASTAQLSLDWNRFLNKLGTGWTGINNIYMFKKFKITHKSFSLLLDLQAPAIWTFNIHNSWFASRLEVMETGIVIT